MEFGGSVEPVVVRNRLSVSSLDSCSFSGNALMTSIRHVHSTSSILGRPLPAESLIFTSGFNCNPANLVSPEVLVSVCCGIILANCQFSRLSTTSRACCWTRPSLSVSAIYCKVRMMSCRLWSVRPNQVSAEIPWPWQGLSRTQE